MSIIFSFIVKDWHICVHRGDGWVGFRLGFLDVVIIYKGFYWMMEGIIRYVKQIKKQDKEN